MLARAMMRINGAVAPADAGNRLMDGRILVAVDGDNAAVTVASILGGIVNRTGTTGATADTLPTVDSLLAALPELNRGDSFLFSIRMVNAHANTVTVGTGMTGSGTINVLASNIRDYLLTLTSGNKRTRVVSGSTSTVTPRVFTNIAAAEFDNISIGMAVTGTGVGASAKVIAMNRTALTVTVDVDSTATADNIALTFTPQMTLFGLQTSAI